MWPNVWIYSKLFQFKTLPIPWRSDYACVWVPCYLVRSPWDKPGLHEVIGTKHSLLPIQWSEDVIRRRRHHIRNHHSLAPSVDFFCQGLYGTSPWVIEVRFFWISSSELPTRASYYGRHFLQLTSYVRALAVISNKYGCALVSDLLFVKRKSLIEQKRYYNQRSFHLPYWEWY